MKSKPWIYARPLRACFCNAVIPWYHGKAFNSLRLPLFRGLVRRFFMRKEEKIELIFLESVENHFLWGGEWVLELLFCNTMFLCIVHFENLVLVALLKSHSIPLSYIGNGFLQNWGKLVQNFPLSARKSAAPNRERVVSKENWSLFLASRNSWWCTNMPKIN